MVVNYNCSGRGPRFSSQNINNEQALAAAVPMDQLPSSGFYGHQTCMQYTHIHAGKTIHIHKIKLKFLKKWVQSVLSSFLSKI